MARSGLTVRLTKNRLPEIARILPEATGVIVKRNGEEAVETAKRLVPKDTHRLEESIRFEMTGQTTGELIAGGITIRGRLVDYADKPEFGTENQSAQPYFRPAIEQQRPKYEADMRRLESFLR